MTCRHMLESAQYVDDAMPTAEKDAFQLHAQNCAECSRAIDRLRRENHGFASAIRGDAPAPPQWHVRPLGTPGKLLRNLTGAMALFWLPAWFLGQQLSSGFASAAAGELQRLPVARGAVACLLLLATFLAWLKARRRRAAALWIALVAVLDPVQAATHRGGEHVVVPADETVAEALVAFGETVRIAGVVEGDFFAFARRVELTGAVRGTVRVFAQEVDISGSVGRGLYTFAESLRVRPGAQVDGDVVAAGRDAALAGRVGGGLRFYGEQLRVMEPARIERAVAVDVDDRDMVQVPGVLAPAGVSIRDDGGRLTEPGFYLRRLTAYCLAVLIALLASRLFPVALQESLIALGRWWRSMATGAAISVFVLIAALVAAMTVAGLPVAMVLIALLVVGVYGGMIIVGELSGRVLLPGRTRFLQPASGLALVFAIVELPFGIGLAARAAVVLAGLGGLLSGVRCYLLFARAVGRV